MRPTKAQQLARLEQGALALAMESGLDAIRAELTNTRNAVRLRGAEPRPLTTPTGGSARAATSPVRLIGFSVRETTGIATALVRLRDGADTGADIVMVISLAPNESARDWFGPGGIATSYGLFVEVVAGGVEGSLYVEPA